MTKVWDDEDNKFLMEHYAGMSNQELAERFGVSKKSIQGKLRRLGLHRNAEEEAQLQEKDNQMLAQEESSGFQFRRKRLAVRVAPRSTQTHQRPPYIPRELTERRKRAMRDFDSAMKILASGDKNKAIEELDFVITTFLGEIDIVQRAQMYKYLLTREIPKDLPPLETADDHYNYATWLHQNNEPEQAFEYYKKAYELDPEYIDALYNIACYEAHSDTPEQALEHLKIILDANENLAESIAEDDDFESLWNNPDFSALLQEYLRN